MRSGAVFQTTFLSKREKRKVCFEKHHSSVSLLLCFKKKSVSIKKDNFLEFTLKFLEFFIF